MLLIVTLILIVVLNNVSTSLYSLDIAVNVTRLCCLSDGIEDQWLGTVVLPGLPRELEHKKDHSGYKRTDIKRDTD